MKNGLCQVGTNGCEACLEFLPVDVYRQVSHENVDVCVRPMRVLRNIICKDPSVCRLILCDDIRKLTEGDAEEGDEARGRLIVELERRCQPLTKEKTESVLAEIVEDDIRGDLRRFGQLGAFVKDDPIGDERRAFGRLEKIRKPT